MKIKKRWTTSNKAVFNTAYHLVWCPKYRRKVLAGSIKDRLEHFLSEKAMEIGVEIAFKSVMPDHVHLFVRASPVDSPHWIVQQFKGYTSHELRKEFSELLKMPTMWTRSYFCESVGHISEKVIQKYIENQK